MHMLHVISPHKKILIYLITIKKNMLSRTFFNTNWCWKIWMYSWFNAWGLWLKSTLQLTFEDYHKFYVQLTIHPFAHFYIKWQNGYLCKTNEGKVKDIRTWSFSNLQYCHIMSHAWQAVIFINFASIILI